MILLSRKTKGIYRPCGLVKFARAAILEDFIMPAVVNREECVSCGTCVEECPEEAITLDDQEIATVNAEKCTECKTCVEACPSEAISVE
jgi:ferredoxin